MPYFDGFVFAVPTANKQKFIDHANAGDAVFVEHGATRVLECWGDDVPHGKLTDFYRAVQAGAMPDRPAFATFYDGANVMYIIDAIVKSHQQQRWVRVAY